MMHDPNLLTDDVRQVILVPAVVVPGVRLEQVVPGGELEGHAGRAPDIRGGSLFFRNK